MPVSKERRRVRQAPGFMLTNATGKSFKWLTPEGMHRVWRRFMQWVDAASQRGADEPFPNTDDLDEQEQDALLNMCTDARAGYDSYWQKYSHPTEVQPTPVPRTSDDRPNEEGSNKKDQMTNQLSEEAPPPALGVGFTPPTVDVVRTYAKEHDLTDDAEKFLAYYRAHGWRYKNGDPLTSWQAAYSLWVLRETRFQQPERRVAAQQYEQREYDEAEMREILGTRSLYK